MSPISKVSIIQITPPEAAALFGIYIFYATFMKFNERIERFVKTTLFNEKYETNAWVYSYIENGTRKKDDGYFTQAGTNAMARITFKF